MLAPNLIYTQILHRYIAISSKINIVICEKRNVNDNKFPCQSKFLLICSFGTVDVVDDQTIRIFIASRIENQFGYGANCKILLNTNISCSAFFVWTEQIYNLLFVVLDTIVQLKRMSASNQRKIMSRNIQ